MLVPNTFQLAVNAESYIQLNSDQSLPDRTPFLVVGQGSNILFTKPKVNFAIVQVTDVRYQVEELASQYKVTLGGALVWHDTVARLIEDGIAGLENLALIPGTVGSAPVQNIGAYGVELADIIDSVTGYDVDTSQRRTLNKGDCKFGYRDSIFKHQLKGKFIIEHVTLLLDKVWLPKLHYGPLQSLGKDVTPKQVFETVCAVRQSKLPDPSVVGNAGSFFKNPVISTSLAEKLKTHYSDLPIYPVSENEVKVAAGYLIDKAGLKGSRVNDAQVHPKQALVLTNIGKATADDIIALAKSVRDKVQQLFSIVLEPEVRFFDADGEIDPNSVL